MKSIFVKIVEWYKDRLSEEARRRIIQVIIFVLGLTIGLGLGYLWRGEIQRAPIIIEKHSSI